MEILELILGFLFFCGAMGGLSIASKNGEEYEQYLKDEYRTTHHNYHN